MKEFWSFGIYHLPMYFMSTRLLKENIDGVSVTQFQLAYILKKNHLSNKTLVKLCSEVHYMWWRNK